MKLSAVLLPFALLCITKIYSQMNVGGNIAPDNSAMLQVSGTTKGFLPPRLTQTQMNAIDNPIKGLIVFNTNDSLLYIRRDTGWVAFSAGEQQWLRSSTAIYNVNSGNVGIGTKTPASNFAVFQTSGTGSSKGVTLTGNSLGSTNTGSGFLMSLGNNASGNKQIWLGDPDYANNSAGTFLRIAVAYPNLATVDAVAGDNSTRRYIALGTGGDANAGVMFGNDLNGTANPSSFVWDNGNMAIGSGYKANAAPANGLLVQGRVGIGTATPNSSYAAHIYGTGTLNTLIDGNNTNGTWLDINNSSTGGGKWGLVSSGSGNGSGKLYLFSYASSATTVAFQTDGNVGIGTISPTAVLQIKAGTATAGTAPLKLTSGINLTTPEDGAIEFDGTNYYATASSTRYTLTKTLTATATLNFPITLTLTSSILTLTVTGAADGDVVSLGVPTSSVINNGIFTAYVSAANTVTVKFNNTSSLSLDPASGTFRVSVLKY